MPQTSQNSISTGRSGFEFALVLIMLGVLTLLVAFILFNTDPKVNISPGSTNFADYLREREMALNYRKDLLAIIIAAFGAWVGAGAAYFFGRENLRESANSLLQLHRQMTGAEKLGTIKVRDIPPKPLNANYDETLTLKDATDKLASNPSMWFISVNTNDKWHIINNEALFIYIKNKMDELSKDTANQQKSYADLNDMVLKTTLKDAIPEIEKQEPTNKFVNRFIEVKLDDSADKVNKEMDLKGVFLAIIKDDGGRFVQYFTTSDIRKTLVNL